jgi:hypothetical protein
VLCLADYVAELHTDHRRYLKHLYLDRNQTYGEIQIKRYSSVVGFLDYMMKLRGKIFREGTNDFHLVMNIGTSVHVLAVKRRIKNSDELTDDEKEAGFAVGDYHISHFDTYCSNTAQGGFETAACIEAGMRELKLLDESIGVSGFDAFCSDAGSGYKSTPYVLMVLREMKELTGVSVRRLHFNASGEGNRNLTDGHNAHLKAHREAALRAGQPSACTTAAAEAKAAAYAGGLAGTTSRILKFGYESKVTVNALPGIQSFHDFKREDGGIRVWKSYDIGPGKFFSDEKLDKLYSIGQTRQGTTGAQCSLHL